MQGRTDDGQTDKTDDSIPSMQQPSRCTAAKKHPCSAEDPWSLVIGFDEFTPGNKLAVDNKRKIMNMSFSFLQLGRALHSDGTWMTPVSVRSSMIAQVQGGWSRMLSLYLRLQLASATGLSLLSTCMEHNSWEPD